MSLFENPGPSPIHKAAGREDRSLARKLASRRPSELFLNGREFINTDVNYALRPMLAYVFAACAITFAFQQTARAFEAPSEPIQITMLERGGR